MFLGSLYSSFSLKSVSRRSKISLRSVSGLSYFVRQTEPKILRLVREELLPEIFREELLPEIFRGLLPETFRELVPEHEKNLFRQLLPKIFGELLPEC